MTIQAATAHDHRPDTFRAFWPITDPDLTPYQLVAVAAEELPALIVQAHAQVVGRGQWRILPSVAVPGSGRVTDEVLVYDAPAIPVAPRPYTARLRVLPTPPT